MPLALLAGCKDHKRTLGGIGDQGGPGQVEDPCTRHAAGCACEDEGETYDCGTVKELDGQYVTCSVGVRTCSAGVWGECVADHEEKKPLSYRAPMQGGYSVLGLGSPQSCNDLCDRECDDVVDTPDGVTVGDDLEADTDGITLAAGSGTGGSCDTLNVTPATATITVTAIATNGAVTTSPTSVDFDGTCANGFTANPAWTLDSYDRAVIDTAGKLTVFSGIAGPISVTGQTGSGMTASTDTSIATVKVLVQGHGSNSTTEASFDSPSGADVAQTLYPYKNTVFPLDLEAPIVQWDRGSTYAGMQTATDVKVALRYPAGCTGPTAASSTTTCTFYYSAIYNSSEPTCTPSTYGPCLSSGMPAWQIPQAVWSAFDRTASGDAAGAEIVIQRRYGGSAKTAMTIPVKFATDSLKGTVYYTQYKRFLTSSGSCASSGTNSRISSGTYKVGDICPVGGCIQKLTKGDATTRAIDLSNTTAANKDPFGGTAGCPVCHSVSANGNRHVSPNQSSQSTGGGTSSGVNDISLVSGTPTFTAVGQPPNYSVVSSSSDGNGEASYGFSYNPIFPDGTRVLQGPTYWGSTQQYPGNTAQNGNFTGDAGALKSYFAVSTSSPGFPVQYATTGALTYSTSGSGSSYTLTGSGSLTIDGVTAGSNDSVLVKNESGANAKNNGVWYVYTASPWALRRRSDADSVTDLAAGREVRVTDGYVNHGRVWYISTAPTTINTTNVVLTERAHTYHFGAGATLTADYATTAALSPVNQVGTGLYSATLGALTVDLHTMVAGESLLVKDQATASQNGIYTVTQQGSGTAGTALSVLYASAAALPTNTRSGNVLTGSVPAPLTVDGSTLVSGDSVLVKNEATGANNGVYTLTTVGVGSGLTPLTSNYATAAALPTNSRSGNVITATNFGALTVDGTTFSTTGSSILVKDETTQANNGIYTVTTAAPGSTTVFTPSAKYATTIALVGTRTTNVIDATLNGVLNVDGNNVTNGDVILVKNQVLGQDNGIYTVTQAGTAATKFKLTRHTSANATGEITSGMHVPVTNGTLNAGTGWYVTNGTNPTINTTAITFASSTKWALTRRTDNDATGDIVAGQQVTISSGTANIGKTFYVTNGTDPTVNTTAITYAQATSWALTRRSDADATGEIVTGTQVAATSGSTNAGKLFVVTTSGTITINTTAIAFGAGTQWILTRRADSDAMGEITPGLEVTVSYGALNAGRSFYVSSPTSGSITPGTTSISYASQTLPSMMAPSMSPDGTKVVYINGDADLAGGEAETGWRRGLSMFSFAWDSGTSTFAASAKKRLYSSYNSSSAGMVLKWPFFEGDSRSVLYVESATDEYCSLADAQNASPNTDPLRACSQGSSGLGSALGARGNMTPTSRGYRPGRIFSIDSGAATPSDTRVELAKLDDAEIASDADKAYQPTVLPFSSGGYRWVIFTSTRAYGNQINPRGYASTNFGTATHFTCAAPMLWLSAVTDTTADGSDRSNPAFMLPGQYSALPTSTSNDYINERGYLVPAPCKEDGDSCSSDDDCCGAPDDSACRAPAGWSPSSGPPAKKCEGLSGTCSVTGDSCSTSADCCEGSCVNFECEEPAGFGQATFVREYTASCPVGYHPVWQTFKYHLTTDSDSKLVFQAQTAEDLDELDAAKVVDVGTSTNTVVAPTAQESQDVGAALDTAKVSKNLAYLRMLVTLVPSTDGSTAPILHDWQVRYTCLPAE